MQYFPKRVLGVAAFSGYYMGISIQKTLLVQVIQ